MFEFAVPETLDDALALWHERARWYAGGTDLVVEIKADRARPTRLIDLKRVEELRGIEATEEGLRLGALTTLADLAANPAVREQYAALAQACEVSASPQLRNTATLGGNLNQDSRCPYYRGPFDCWLKGGASCFMRDGENREAALVGYAECVHAHPSDPLTALVALDARVVARALHSIREIAAGELARAPGGEDRRLTVLYPEELVTAILLPRQGRSRSVYLKAMDRAAWTFAMAGAAIRLDFDGDRIAGARVVLGGIAPLPWRCPEAEGMLEGKRLSPDLILRASAAILPEARPLAHNRYKVRLARGLVKRALEKLAHPTEA